MRVASGAPADVPVYFEDSDNVPAEGLTLADITITRRFLDGTTPTTAQPTRELGQGWYVLDEEAVTKAALYVASHPDYAEYPGTLVEMEGTPEGWTTLTEATLDDLGHSIGEYDAADGKTGVRVGGALRAGVLIEAMLVDGTRKNSTLTDGDGEFDLALPPGATYTIRASLDGYVSESVEVTV